MKTIQRIIVATIVIACSACANVPISGPVEKVGPIYQTQPDSGVDVAAQAPLANASIDSIVEGFLTACESGADGYAIARQYLTAEAAQQWNPEQGMTIFETPDTRTVTVTEGRATIQGTVVGTLDAQAKYTATDTIALEHDFQMTRVDGQWRINDPGEGVLISRQRFRRSFTPVPIYFFNSLGTHLVPDLVYLREREITADALVKSLLAGPDAWLSPAVFNAIPADATTSGTYIENRVAKVSLSAQVENLNGQQRRLVAAQIYATLSYFDDADAVQISVNGRVVPIEGADTNQVIRQSSVEEFLPTSSTNSVHTIYGIRDDRIVRTEDTMTSTVAPVEADGTQQPIDDPGELAVSAQSGNMAVIARGQTALLWSPRWGVPLDSLTTGTQLVSPQFDSLSRLWVVDNREDGSYMLVFADDEVRQIALEELPEGRITAFAISPDSTRVAIVMDHDGEQTLGMMRIKEAETITVSGWRTLPLTPVNGSITQISDLAFTSSLKLMLIASAERDGFSSVYSTDINASQIDSQGPLTDIDPVEITSVPSQSNTVVLLRTRSGTALEYEAQYRWAEVGDSFQYVTYPS